MFACALSFLSLLLSVWFMNPIIGFFLPKETEFFSMLEKQSSTILEAYNEFQAFIQNYPSLSEQQRLHAIGRIGKLEGIGDAQTRDITDLLHKSLITPYDREDIHAITVHLDDVIDLIDATARKMVLYNIRRIPSPMFKQVALLLELVQAIHSTVLELHALDKMKGHCEELYRLEHRADALYEDAISSLFSGFEKETDPVLDVIKYRDLYGQLEDIFDTGKYLADTVRTIVVKHG